MRWPSMFRKVKRRKRPWPGRPQIVWRPSKRRQVRTRNKRRQPRLSRCAVSRKIKRTWLTSTNVSRTQELAAAYAKWMGSVEARQRASLHDMIRSALWVIIILLLVFAADRLIDRFFTRFTSD